MLAALGIDLGATHVKFVHVDAGGVVIEHGSFETRDGLGAEWREYIRERLLALAEDRGAEFVGVCAPGLAAGDGRSIAWMRGRLEGVQGIDWTEFLGWPRVVPVLNDAHAALVGELWLGQIGAERAVRNAVLLTLGTGVGGAILCEGQLLRGRLGRAGHLGHITVDAEGEGDIVGTPGSLEDAIGDWTVAARSGGRFATTRELVAAHVAGDARATAVWLRSVRRLAAGVSSIINAVDPEVVIIGGGIAAAGEALFGPLRKYLDEMEWRPTGEGVRIAAAGLGEMAGAVGAARWAMGEKR